MATYNENLFIVTASVVPVFWVTTGFAFAQLRDPLQTLGGGVSVRARETRSGVKAALLSLQRRIQQSGKEESKLKSAVEGLWSLLPIPVIAIVSLAFLPIGFVIVVLHRVNKMFRPQLTFAMVFSLLGIVAEAGSGWALYARDASKILVISTLVTTSYLMALTGIAVSFTIWIAVSPDFIDMVHRLMDIRPPTDEPPTDGPPTDEPPTDEPPTDEPPTDE